MTNLGHFGTEVRVQWLNQQNEQFDFYDIAVQFPDGRQEFYEVKTTVTTDKRLLAAWEATMEISPIKKTGVELLNYTICLYLPTGD